MNLQGPRRLVSDRSMQQYRSFRAKFIVMAKGFAMGLADIIPGVSGGTIALISGIYDHLIHAIGSVQLRHGLSALKLVLFFWNGPRRREALAELQEIEWGFLLPLLSGIVIALLIMTRIIPFVLENYAYHAYAFFFGLILFSITVPFRMMERRWQEFAVMAVAAVGVFFLVGISRVSEAKLEFRGDNLDQQIFTDAKGKWKLSLPAGEGGAASAAATTLEVTVTTPQGQAAGVFRVTVPSERFAQNKDGERVFAVPTIDDSGLKNLRVAVKAEPAESETYEIHGQLISEGTTAPLFVLFSGALAICAMILPGISGAYILVILGQYKLTTSALRDAVQSLKDTVAQGALSPELWPSLSFVLLFVAGIAVGIFSFVRLLRFVLDRYHSLTMAVLTGLMIGSLRGLWPVNHLHGQELSSGLIAVGVGLALLGVVAIFALEMISKKLGDPEPPV